MREAHAVMNGPGQPSPVDVLARVALAVHGPASLDEKLAWATEALRTLTGASLGAYVGLGTGDDCPTAASGVASYEVDNWVRPALDRLGSTGRRIVSPELRRDRRWRTFLERAGHPTRADAMGVAVQSSEGRFYGLLIAVHPEEDHFDGQDEAAALALAAHLGVALDNEVRFARLAEIQQEQRGVVHALQEALRPPIPAVEFAELGLHYLPADQTAPTGGDLHDWLVLPDGDVLLAVVDVMGKGVTATKDAVAVTHALRLLSVDGCPLEHLVARADALLTAHNPDLVATVVVARYRPSDGRLAVANGGQPPPLLMTGDGAVQLLSAATGVAVGWPGAGTNEVVELKLERNDTLVLYTDGLIESTKDVLMGLDNLVRAAGEVARYPSAHLARALVERSLSGAMRRDDALALVLRRRTPPPPDAAGPLAPFEYRFSPSRATIPLARHLLSDWLEHLTVESAERDDLLLVASELCANAVKAASGAPSALAMRAWAEGDAIVLEVEDDGKGFELNARYDDEVPDLDAERGRGLYVVQALADDVTVDRIEGRTIVRVVRRAVLPER